MNYWLLIACSAVLSCSGGSHPEIADDLDQLVAVIARDGFTCAHQTEMSRLSGEETIDLRVRLAAKVTEPELARLVDRRDACAETSTEDYDSSAQEITSTYSVVQIPKTSGTSGSAPKAILRDGSPRMCGNDKLADYVAQYSIAGSYTKRADLRVRGTNLWGNCYLRSANGARVYTDGDIRMCIGYWSVFACGAVIPFTSDTRVWLK